MICAACSIEGAFVVPGVPGVLAYIRPAGGFFAEFAERCDDCQVYASDEDAVLALVAAGYIPCSVSEGNP